MSTVSIRLSFDLATVECHSCSDSVAVSTADKEALAAQVRDFLGAHTCCNVPEVAELESWLS